MRTWILVAIVAAASPAFAKELAPVAEIRLAPKGVLDSFAYCAPTRFIAASIAEGHSSYAKGFGALYQLDAAKKKATKIGDLPEAHEYAFNASCSALALGVTTGSGDTQVNDVHIYSLSAKKTTLVVSFGKFAFPVSAITWIDDKTLAVGLNKGPVKLWSVDATPKELSAQEVPGNVMDIAYTSGLVAVGIYEGGVYSAPVANGKLGAFATIMRRDSDTRTTGSLNVDTGEVVMPGGGRVFDVTFADGGKRLLATSERGNVVAWPVVNGIVEKGATLVDKMDGTSALALSTDDKLFAAGDSYRVGVWQSNGKHVTDLGKLDRIEKYAGFRGLAFIGPRELLVGAMKDAVVRLYRVK